MLSDTGLYAGLMRAVLEDKIDAIVGGPNCRSRSVLRNYPIPNQPRCPRPVRRWNGEEHGIEDATQEEKKMIAEDDVLLWRMMFLAMVSIYLRDARRTKKKFGFLIEQPASPRDYMPQTVSWWDTQEWKALAREFGWKEETYNQGQLGGLTAKPATFGGSLILDVPKHRMPKTAKVEVESSKDLARWSPGTMNMVAEALVEQIEQAKPKLKPLSWEDHLAHGHTPFRRDCVVCQQALQQCKPHRQVAHPI